MNRHSQLFLLAPFAILSLLLSAASDGAVPLRAGASQADITPPHDFPVCGYYHERLATGTHDPLYARALVLQQGEEAFAYVAADLTGVTRDLYAEAQRRVEQETGIDRLVISATHSHTAPDYRRHLFDHLASGSSSDSSYAEKLLGGIVTSVKQAHKNLEPVSVRAGSVVEQADIAFNRRFVMRDGSVKTWQKLSNKNVVRAAGPIDREIGLLTFNATESGETQAAFSNYALHLDTVGGTKWSVDYPFYVHRAIRDELGEQVVSLFGLGACGDINHVNPASVERNKTDVIGNALASTIRPALAKLAPTEHATLDVRWTTARLPLQTVTSKQIDRARKLIPIASAGGKVDFFDLVASYKAVLIDQLRNSPAIVRRDESVNWAATDAYAGVGTHLPVDVATVTLGKNTALVFLPGEVFVELGLAIKNNSPFANTFVVELSNCSETMYVPTQAAYAGGSYEVGNSTLRPGAGELLVETALRLLRESASELAGIE